MNLTGQEIPLVYYLVLSAILFGCGVTGFLIKRNIITIFMSIELMLNAVNLSFVAFASYWGSLHPEKADQFLSGQVFVFFVMVVAAAEAAVGLAIIIAVFRTRETLNPDRVNLLKL
jgi:NADH-quinone oxidoreductase subunit K